jgi:hypothetical protein
MLLFQTGSIFVRNWNKSFFHGTDIAYESRPIVAMTLKRSSPSPQ